MFNCCCLRTCSLGLSARECQKYAVVHERIGGVDRPEVICSGSVRTREVYLSQSNSILIDTFGSATDDDVTTHEMTRFLLKYEGTLIVLVYYYVTLRSLKLKCLNIHSFIHSFIGDLPLRTTVTAWKRFYAHRKDWVIVPTVLPPLPVGYL